MEKVKKNGTPSKQGEGGGQPPKYTREHLSVALDVYFAKLKKSEPPQKAGICVALDISKETFSQYKKKYPDLIKKAEAQIEKWWIARLAKSAPVGAIFYLKNAFKEDYKDRVPGEDPQNPVHHKITGMVISKEK